MSEAFFKTKTKTRLIPAAMIVGALAAQAEAISPHVPQAVPGDCVAAVFIDPPRPDASSGTIRTTLDFATFLADRAQHFGLVSMLPDSVRIWLDALASVSVATKHPVALVLIDIEASPQDKGGHRLAGLRAALIAHTRGDNDTIEQRIRHLLKTYTNSEKSLLTLSEKTKPRRFDLRDQRLPDWASITWGRLGDYYVVAVGVGAFDQIARTLTKSSTSLMKDSTNLVKSSTSSRKDSTSLMKGSTSLANQDWFRRACSTTEGRDAFLSFYVQFDALRERADAPLAAKIEKVLAALRLTDVRRGLWSVRRDRRALEVVGLVRRNHQDERVPIAGARFLPHGGEEIIPPGATGYTAFRWRPKVALERIGAAYLASKSPSGRRSIRAFWEGVQSQSRVSIPDDIFANLGDTVVIHNYPRHVLGLPLAWTIWIPIKGDAETLRSSLDRLLLFASGKLAESGVIRIKRTPDRTWYLFAGLSGPALAVTDRWLVVSFSPTAVQQNLTLLPQLARDPKATSD